MAITPRQVICPQSNWVNKCPYPMTAEYITIHNTANDASANNEIAYMNRNTNQVSFHFAVDDKEVVQGIPLDRNAWHAGDGANGTGNRKSIAIEICYSKSGGVRFDDAEQLAAEFTAQLLRERGWGINKVKKHQDWSGKNCPHRTIEKGWQRFLNMIEAYLNPPAPVTIKWVDNAGVGEIDGTTDLIDLKTNKSIKRLAGKFEYAQTTEDGEWARTAYSKANNIDNGVRTSSFKKPVSPTFNWVNTPETTMFIKGETNLINLDTNTVIKVVSGNFTFVQKTDDGQYVRTEYSKKNNINSAVRFDALEPIPTPPVTEEPEPGDVPDQTITILQSIITFIQTIIDKLKKKE